MDLQQIVWIAIPLVGSLIAFVMRHIMARLDTLEQTMQTKISEQAVRTLVSDKLDPLKEDMHEIKVTLNKLLDFYMGGK